MIGHAFVKQPPARAPWAEDVQRLISSSPLPDSFKLGYAKSLVSERAVDLFGAEEVCSRLRQMFEMQP